MIIILLDEWDQQSPLETKSHIRRYDWLQTPHFPGPYSCVFKSLDLTFVGSLLSPSLFSSRRIVEKENKD